VSKATKFTAQTLYKLRGGIRDGQQMSIDHLTATVAIWVLL